MDLKELHKFTEEEHERLLKHYDKLEKSKVKYTMFAKLVEEVGEFSEALLASESLQRGDKLNDKKTDINTELADIILVSFLLSKELNIDLDKALSDKIEKIKKRNYK